mmetsp:Transcript_15007/g.37765  ORF Transcript_15007/g.37765 Transcript_15007/m.37765 type:complete len:232 (-) Transcript_15007:772-1467(-)
MLGCEQIAHDGVRLDAINKHGNWQQIFALETTNELIDVRLIGDDVLAVEQHTHDGFRGVRFLLSVPRHVVWQRREISLVVVGMVHTQSGRLYEFLWLEALRRRLVEQVFFCERQKCLLDIVLASLIPVRVYLQPVAQVTRLLSGNEAQKCRPNLQERQITDKLVLFAVRAELGQDCLDRGRRTSLLAVFRWLHGKRANACAAHQLESGLEYQSSWYIFNSRVEPLHLIVVE